MKLHHGCEFMELKKTPKPTAPKILIHTSPGPVLLQLPLLLEDLGLPWKGFFDTNSFGGRVFLLSMWLFQCFLGPGL